MKSAQEQLQFSKTLSTFSQQNIFNNSSREKNNLGIHNLAEQKPWSYKVYHDKPHAGKLKARDDYIAKR